MQQVATPARWKESCNANEKKTRLKPLSSKISLNSLRFFAWFSSLRFLGDTAKGPFSSRSSKNAWCFPIPVGGSQVISAAGLSPVTFDEQSRDVFLTTGRIFNSIRFIL